MKCQNCGTKISASFTFAIKNNQCPACGHSIMDSKKLGSYLSLQSLLETKLPDIDSQKVANLIVTNFEVKQLFQEDLNSETEEGSSNNEESHAKESVVEVDEDDSYEENEDVKYDEEYKAKQMEDARERLKSLREEALSEATAEHWGLGDANGLVNPATLSVEEKLRWEQDQRRQNIESGSAGAFRRGS